ncbi:MAG: Cof-type HAD-IIB family hydrolase [Burkholderiales bacterium]|nr:Cof-type HAD-IIB family hydrolase [Burkholderiales bacterium]
MSSHKYKLIAFDIDGTIVDSNNKVCSMLIDVVAELKKKGIIFTLVSARVPQSVFKLADAIGITNDFIIALNGGLIINNKLEIPYSKSFAISRIQNLLSMVDTRVSRHYYHELIWAVEYPSEFTDLEDKVYNTNSLIKEIPKLVNKITLTGSTQLLQQAQKILSLDKSLEVSFSHKNYLEITCNSISKYNGLKHLAKLKNVASSEIIAFGDSENDISMLSQVGLGVAMGNALDHVKDKAKDIAGNHDEQGVALYLTKLFKL